jgi:hypothetical protein
VAQDELLQEAQLGALLAIARPPLEAKKSDSMREVWSLAHCLQATGASESFIDRIISKRWPQSRQTYS